MAFLLLNFLVMKKYAFKSAVLCFCVTLTSSFLVRWPNLPCLSVHPACLSVPSTLHEMAPIQNLPTIYNICSSPGSSFHTSLEGQPWPHLFFPKFGPIPTPKSHSPAGSCLCIISQVSGTWRMGRDLVGIGEGTQELETLGIAFGFLLTWLLVSSDVQGLEADDPVFKTYCAIFGFSFSFHLFIFKMDIILGVIARYDG